MKAGPSQCAGGDGLFQGRLAARSQGQVGPIEHGRPLVPASQGDGGDAGVLELLDDRQELLPGRRRLGDAGLLEEVLVVPEAHQAEVVGRAVLDAVDLVDAHAGRVHAVDPVGDLIRDRPGHAGGGLLGEDATAPGLEDVRRGPALHLDGEPGLEGLVLEDSDVDLDVGVLGHVLVGDRLAERQARFGRLDVPPVDLDRILAHGRSRSQRAGQDGGGHGQRSRAKVSRHPYSSLVAAKPARSVLRPSGPFGLADSYHTLASACKATASGMLPAMEAPVLDPPADSAADASAEASSRPRRPTIFDVARHSGVSYSTVSRVVTGHVNVKPATRARVQAAMAELGYVAHVTARALAKGRTQAIGLLAQEIDNPFFSVVIKGVDQEVSGADYDLLLCTTHSRRGKEAEYVARLAHGMVDGLLIVLPTALPEYVAQLRAERYPFVLIDHDSEAPGCTVVNAANRTGTREGIAYLIGLGHRRIGFITGRQDVGATHQRLAGYRDAMAEAGLDVDERLVVPGDFLEPRGHAATLELLSLRQPPTAIFASSDVAAFGVLAAAREAGLRVPEDLSVLGFDDIVEASSVGVGLSGGVGLSTVRQPLREMGRVAVQRLLALLADRSRPATRVVMETELVVRSTTAPPRRGQASEPRRSGRGTASPESRRSRGRTASPELHHGGPPAR